jgi:histidine triad (HIT) family protein
MPAGVSAAVSSTAGTVSYAAVSGADGCIFCAIAAGDGPAHIVDSDERTLAFMDINPATRGHALVIPREHSSDLLEIGEEDLAATMAAARRLAQRMRDTISPDGINILNSCGRAAWQTVFHFHLHVVPRYDKDPLKLPWRPTTGDSAEIERVAAQIRL